MRGYELGWARGAGRTSGPRERPSDALWCGLAAGRRPARRAARGAGMGAGAPGLARAGRAVARVRGRSRESRLSRGRRSAVAAPAGRGGAPIRKKKCTVWRG